MVPMIGESSNEMPVEMPGDSNNEMHDDLNNVMPETNVENAEDCHVVNGDSYASRAARTVSQSTRHGRRGLDSPRM